jgi:3,4-dihydroxy 2-butanone 4-phosphate synthase/GTP cyclohydrolase II
VVYLHGHEGRGIGLIEKLRAYELQDAGLDTVEANLSLGHPADGRGYEVAVGILRELGVTALRLLTNNPAKCAGVERLGLTVTDRVPLLTPPTADNIAYLRTKRSRLGHLYNVQLAPLAVAGGTGD